MEVAAVIPPIMQGTVTQVAVTKGQDLDATYTSYSVQGDGLLREMVRGSDGNLWFLQDVNAISRITTSGVVTRFPRSTGKALLRLSAEPDGYIWYTDPDADMVGRISASGSYGDDFKLRNKSRPTDLSTMETGEVWVSATKNGRISGILPEEKKIREVGEFPSRGSYGVVRAYGKLWGVTGSRLFAISPSGEMVFDMGLPGDPWATDPLVTPEGELWYFDLNRNRVCRVSETGDVAEYDVGRPVKGIAAGPDGAIWGTFGDSLFRLKPSGELSLLRRPDEEYSAASLAFGSDGNLWVASTRRRIFKAVLTNR